MVPVTDMDRRQAERRAQNKAASGAVPDLGKPTSHSKAQQPAARKSDRWSTFNTFMDVIAPRLTLAERTVWIVMFRHARNGTCDISERAIATQANIDKVTAGKALRQLVALKLVWVVFKSTHKESLSRYGLQPSPADRLAAVIRMHDARTTAADARRQRNGGDRRGHRRKQPTG